MSMSYDYSDRRKRKEPTAAKRRRGERQPVPLDQRPENPKPVRSVPRAVNVRAVFVVAVVVLVILLAVSKGLGVW